MGRMIFLSAMTLLACVGSVTHAQTVASDSGQKPRLAVVDFVVKGDVGVKDAGASIADLLANKFDSDRYQLVERQQLEVLLKEADLTLAGIQ